MKIYQVPTERRYWVVRAEGGKYYDHFVRYGVVSLGHLNILDLPNLNQKEHPLDWEQLQAKLKSILEKDPNLRTTGRLHLSQAKSFLYEMKLGDWVITVGPGSVRFGRIVSGYFIEKKPLVIAYDEEKGQIVECSMDLRRNVVWGPTIARRDLPYGLLLSLKANQTVFSLDAKWDALYHTLYPAFLKDRKLYLSAKIKTENAIKNHNIAIIFKLLDEIEVIGKQITLNAETEDFDSTIQDYINRDLLTVTTKAQFHSPGDIWNAISSLAGTVDLNNWATYTVLAYSMIFGNKISGFDGLIDLETRKKLWDLIIARKLKNKADKVVEDLDIKLPNIDTSKLEDSSRDQI